MNNNEVNPLDMLEALLPGGIEAQEARGQQQFVASQALPIDGLEWRFGGDRYEVTPKEYLTSLGFVFGEFQDDMFINVTLPEGWTMEPSDHSMWSYVNDADGYTRISIFYKAAFYDRSAHFDLNCRFRRNEIYESNERYKEGACQWYVSDGDVVIYTSKEYLYDEKYSDEYWVAKQGAEDDVATWLNETYPDWASPMGHWEDQTNN